MMKQAGATFFILSLLLTGCSARHASMPMPEMAERVYQSVQVNTPGVMGAQCSLNTGGGTYNVAAPGRITVERTAAPMTVVCRKGEHFQGVQTIRPRKVWERENVMAYMYPNTISVAMSIGGDSFQRNVTFF